MSQNHCQTMRNIFFFFLFGLPLLALCVEKQVYIVHIGEHDGDKALHELEETHHSYLSSVKETEEEASASLLYSYKHSINGFAAVLTQDEASKLSEMEGVVTLHKSNPRKYSVQTTRSWEFVGLQEGEGNNWNHHFTMGSELLLRAGYGKDVIIGLVDSGVWPESKSFRDDNVGSVSKSWKGICQSGVGANSFRCNKKIIGARYYLKGFEHHYGPLNATEDCRSPRDLDGHGTHTASTVAGNWVHGVAAYGGFARGTASGGAPLAHLAIYKACWAIPNVEKIEGNTCVDIDMLAAIDDAIADGVHVLSISIGTADPTPYSQDGIALGAYNAIKKNIVVVCAAGNQGPAPSRLSNTAPWILTVGASTLDRKFLGSVVLGNGRIIKGETATPRSLDKMYPLVYAADVIVPGVPENVSSQCLPNSLAPEKVKGKIVLCMRGAGLRIGKGLEVKRAGGAGFILGNNQGNGEGTSADPHVLPASAVGAKDAIEILKYIKSSQQPQASISRPTTVLGYKPAPEIAPFSSRGPNVIDPNILKPDIIAPGVNVLAAWSGASPPTKLSMDSRRVEYNLESGTSMACPHVAAAAALLRAMHPDWSPAAIRSALMTSAWTRNNMGRTITNANGTKADPFQFGSGHFRPAKAADPGLVYDASLKDYTLYLCSYGVGDPNLGVIKCPKKLPPTYNLNYPSIAIPRPNNTVTINRTVTNVGPSKSVYFFTVKPPLGFSVKASPSVLFFDRVGQKRSFTVTVKARDGEKAKEKYKDGYTYGWYTWTDSHHYVRSPMVVSLA